MANAEIQVLIHAGLAERGKACDHGATVFDDDAADGENWELGRKTSRNSRSCVRDSAASGATTDA